MIDSLSLDIIHEDLSHLTGEAICGNYESVSTKNGKKKIDYVSIEYLLDILISIQEWIKIKNNIHDHFDDHNVSSDSQNMSEKILKEDEKGQIQPSSKTSLKENFSLNTEKNDLIFKSYMKEMEDKYNSNNKIDYSNKKITTEHINEVTEDHDENIARIITDINSMNLTKSSSSSSSSNEIRENYYDYFNTDRKDLKENTKIQTVQNELNIIKSNITSNCNKSNDYLNDVINHIYNNDLEDAKFIYSQSLNNIKRQSDLTEKLFRDSCGIDKTPYTRNKIKPTAIMKGVLLPKKSHRRSSSVISNKSRTNSINVKIKSKTRSSSVKYENRLSKIIIGENGILNYLLEQFPYLYTSPETIHYLWTTHSKQMEILSKKQMEIEKKYFSNNLKNLELDESKSKIYQGIKTQALLKDQYKKQKAFMDILRKDMKHKERIEDMKKLKKLENVMKAEQREQRFRNAKSKRYYEEMCLEKKAKMLQQSTAEELVFKNLFHETMKLQKERLLELERYAKEKNELNVEKQLNNLQSIENYYKRKFELLKENVKLEKNQKSISQKSQHDALNKLRFNCKGILRNQILDLQQQMCRDNDHIYWRKLDSDRLKSEIQKASYIN